MSNDPFYTDLAEIKIGLSELAVSLQKLLDKTPVRQNGTTITTISETNEQTGGGNFDKQVVQEIVKLISKLETQLKDLTDTFAIQTTNAKKLSLSSQELMTRKEHVETHQKSLDAMRENFVYLIKDDPAVHRTSKERKHTVEKKDARKVAFEPITMDTVNSSKAQPSSVLNAFAVESDSDDELEVRHFQKDVPFATSQLHADSELGPLRLTFGQERRGPLVRARDWITQSRRNCAIFTGSNVFVIVIVFLVFLSFA